jgi:hypothetical protein
MSDASAESDGARRGSTRGDGSTSRRKTYLTPKLVEYGSASKLTTAKPGSNPDGANSTMMTPCL